MAAGGCLPSANVGPRPGLPLLFRGGTIARDGTIAGMRILLAPDSFGGTLTAVQAAAALAAGWREAAPDVDLDLAPVSDGGPGFLDVLHAALGGRLVAVTVADPLRRPTSAEVLVADGTAYVESAQAAGLHLLTPTERDPGRGTSFGVGELLRAALDAGVERVVVGLGGSGTNDGGAGMLVALGLRLMAGSGAAVEPTGAALAGLARVEPAGVDDRLGRTVLVAATDVDNPLLGPTGASAVYGPQKGASPDQVQRLDHALARWAAALAAARPGAAAYADAPGAGAAGGLGFALLVLGARRQSGIDLVLDAVRLPERIAAADLVVTGEGSFDWQSLRGKATSGVAAAAAAAGLPCVVVAGSVAVGRREMAAHGVAAAYSVAESAGSVRAAMEQPAMQLQRLAARVAGSWSRPAEPGGR